MQGGNTPTGSGSRTPRTPTAPPGIGGVFPPIDKQAIKDVCKKVDTKISKMASSFEANHGRMPDERTLTETLAYKLGKDAGKISFHTQAQEGVSGTDLLLQMTLVDGMAEVLAHELQQLAVQPSGQSDPRTRAGKKSTSNTPVPGGSSTTAATSTAKKLIIILQAKSYHSNPDKEKEHTPDYKIRRKPTNGEPERIAGFTYQGDTTSNPTRKLQMHLLKDYADHVRKQNTGVEVIAGYIVYSGKATNEDHEYSKGIAWIPLDELIAQCEHFNGVPCDKADPLLDKELSKEFMDLELKKGADSKCFLEDILHPHLDSSV
ncbi:hypothetical protein FRC16_009146 [Serendipita sp. 398]|nr:hypothetical protein FRC16_009146 [Serendipita sp. 398]